MSCRSWRDQQGADELAVEAEVEVQAGGSAREVSVQARDDPVAAVRQSLFAGDRDAILVLRRGSGLPFAELVGPATGLSVVDRGGVAGEELDDRVDVPLGVGLEIPLDCIWSAAQARHVCSPLVRVAVRGTYAERTQGHIGLNRRSRIAEPFSAEISPPSNPPPPLFSCK